MNLNVISFNIRCCDDKDGHSIPERAPRLKKVIAPFDADVIGFQEYTPAWDTEIVRDFGDTYEIFNKYRAEKSLESAPILWKKDKFDCVKKGFFWLSDTPEQESKGWDEWGCFRICNYAVLKERKSGKAFTFINTHFGFGDKCHIDSANLIYNYCKQISQYPTFITGDFNMTPESLGYKEMTKFFTDVNAVTVNDLSNTYHGYNPEEERDGHIDYCFINDKVKPINYNIIKDTVDGKFPSDHYGLLIVLEV